MMMEGYGHNPLVFDLMYELAWRDDIDLPAWIEEYAALPLRTEQRAMRSQPGNPADRRLTTGQIWDRASLPPSRP